MPKVTPFMINPDDDRPVESSDELSLPEKKSCKDANLTCKMAKKKIHFLIGFKIKL